MKFSKLKKKKKTVDILENEECGVWGGLSISQGEERVLGYPGIWDNSDVGGRERESDGNRAEGGGREVPGTTPSFHSRERRGSFSVGQSAAEA